MLRVGRFAILGKDDRLVSGPPPEPSALAARVHAIIERQRELIRKGDAVIARQYDLVTQVESERDLLRAQVRERNELLLEQQIALDTLNERLASVMRHPVTGEPPGEAA